jgi:outer membrane receptor protein involved in Fe transport
VFVVIEARRRVRIDACVEGSDLGGRLQTAVAQRDARSRAFRRLMLTAAAALLLVGQAVLANEATTGAIGGRVKNSAGAPLPGVKVTVTSGQGSKVYMAEADGRFLAPYLTPDVYTVRVDLAGYAAAEHHGVEVRLGKRVELEFTLPRGAYNEALEVVGTAPMVDFSSAHVSTDVKSSFLERLPVERRLSGLIYVAPGVSSGGSIGTENPSMSGGSGLENQYVMDGVSIADPKLGTLGQYSRGYGSLGSGVTSELVDEIQVKTAGSDAEYGRSTGGLVNVITKSGSNAWRGSVFAYLTPERLEGDPAQFNLVNSGTTTVGEEFRDMGFTLGGPLVKDRAFFYVAVDPQYDRTTLLAPPGYPLHALGGVDRIRRSTPYAGKVTLTLGPEHRIDVSAFGEPATSPKGPQSLRAMTGDSTASFDSLDYGSANQTAHYQGLPAAPLLVEGSVGHVRQTFTDTPYLDAWSIRDQTVKPTKRSGGKGSYDLNSFSDGWQYEAKTTYLLGSHEIKVGGSFEDTDMEANSAYTGPPVTLPNGQQTSSGVTVTILPDSKLGRIYRASSGLLFSQQRANVSYLGAFAQDKFQLGPRWTLSAGLRYERERMKGSAESFTFGDNFAPRLGLTWDATGEGRLKVFASYGVYFAKQPGDLALTAFSPYGRVSRADYYDAALTQPIPEGVSAGGTTTHFLTKGASAAIIDPTAKLGYIHEDTLGAEFQAAPQLNVGVRYIHRDTPRILEDVTNAAMVLYVEHIPGLANTQYMITNPRANYPATLNGVGAFENPIHDYDAVELTADKRFANGWALLASYRWSRLWGTYEGFYYNGLNEPKPGETTFDDYPTNDPSYTQIGVPQYGFTGDVRYLGRLGAGPLPNDRTHQLKLYATYAAGRGLNLGTGFWLSSGQPLTPMTSDPVSGYTGYIPLAPRGSGIMTVDGFKTRTPWVWSLDLHADYGFKIAPSRVVLSVDVANVFNKQAVTAYDQNTQQSFGTPDPDFGKRTAYQDPRLVRFGVRVEF